MRQESILPRGASMPRAITGRVLANSDAVRLIGEIQAAQQARNAQDNERFGAIEAALNGQAAQMAGLGLNGGGDNSLVAPPEPAYTAAFASYARNGDEGAAATLRSANMVGDRAAIHAGMTEGDNSSGGYLAPVEWDRKIQQAQRALSPMRRISAVVTSGRAAYSTLWSDIGWGSGWAGETASRPATATPTITPLIFPAGEIFANPAATQRMLDDAAINTEQWIAQSLSDEFSRQEGIAFIRGDGVNKPMGLLQYAPGGLAPAHPGGPMGVTISGSATTISNTDALVDMKYGLAAPYRQNAIWLMNSQTAAVIAKMKDGEGNYIWRESLLSSEPSTLLGRPVEIDENMPNVGAAVDGGPPALPIAFGDFKRGYLVNDRVGIRILRDPYTNKPYVSFYSTKRVGGGLLDPNAIRFFKIAAA